MEDSQIVRYFLQLLSSTAKIPEGVSDIRRATLLAAPFEWFRDKKNWDTWQYFLDKYTDIARHFDVTPGKLEIDNCSKLCPHSKVNDHVADSPGAISEGVLAHLLSLRPLQSFNCANVFEQIGVSMVV